MLNIIIGIEFQVKMTVQSCQKYGWQLVNFQVIIHLELGFNPLSADSPLTFVDLRVRRCTDFIYLFIFYHAHLREKKRKKSDFQNKLQANIN